MKSKMILYDNDQALEDNLSLRWKTVPYNESSEDNYTFVAIDDTSIELQEWIPMNKLKKPKSQIIIENQIANLRNLHRSLDKLQKECKDEGFEVFSEKARENARQILNAIYQNFPDYEYYIYPTEDREIAIDCNPQKGKGVLILCDSKGSVAYFSTSDGKNSRFRCDNIENFPYELLWKIFKEFSKITKYSLRNKSFIKEPLKSFKTKDAVFHPSENITYG